MSSIFIFLFYNHYFLYLVIFYLSKEYLLMVVLVKYDATKNCLVTVVSQQKRILKRMYYMQHNHSPTYTFNLFFSLNVY
jgi:hypothetical protein